MRTVKEFINSEKYVKDLDPLLNSFLHHQLKHDGCLQDDYSLYDLRRYFDEIYSTGCCSMVDVTAIWSFMGLLEDGVLV